MRISIVTPSFNQAQFIRRTIDSVLDQQGDFELDYRVVDGGSTDGTLEILKAYGDRVLWHSEPDRGQVDAINKGLRLATGEVVSWLNSDDVLLPGALARVAAAFTAEPDREWLHGRCVIIDAEDREVRRWVSAYKDFRSRHHTFENFLTENYISQMTAFWRRGVHDSIGYLDSSIRFAFDYDLFVRLAQRGEPIYVPDPIACFRWYETSKSGSGFVVQMAETAEIGARQSEATAWTKARAWAKKLAIINIYRALAVARRLRARSADSGA
jgi:glycosyltransferase involved in cell wall biosynthesis